MFDPSDLPPVGTENVTVVHQRGDRHVTTVGKLTEVDDHLGGFTLWLEVRTPVSASALDGATMDYPIDSHRIVSVSPNGPELARAKRAREMADGLRRMADWLLDHPEVVPALGVTVEGSVEVNAFGLAERAEELSGNPEGLLDFGGGVVIDIYVRQPERVA